MENLIRTDLAIELRNTSESGENEGVIYNENSENGVKYAEMSITNEKGARSIGKDIGRYVTVMCGKPWLVSDNTVEGAAKLIARIIREMLPENCRCVLAVGLGNRDITSDSLGPSTVDGLLVTRHIKEYNGELFESIGQIEVAALSPGVVGQTGIETFEIIKGAVESVKPDALIAIDALAARSVDRLACTVQISDTGISPGSGIGNRRVKISSETLGVPVISVGVPTVVGSPTLVYSALEEAGIEDVDERLIKVLENKRDFFVTLKESDVALAESAKLLSDALNRAFLRGA